MYLIFVFYIPEYCHTVGRNTWQFVYKLIINTLAYIYRCHYCICIGLKHGKEKNYKKYRLTGHELKDKERRNRRRGGWVEFIKGEEEEVLRDCNARQL